MNCNGCPLCAASHPVSYRSNAEKREAVLKILRDPNWSQWSDGMIARHLGVSQPFVGNVRRSFPKTPSRRYINGHGGHSIMDVDNTGKA